MKAFVSSTFWDLRPERKSAISAIEDFGHDVEAMEIFIAKPTLPLDAVLNNLRGSDFVILLVGFKAGSLLPRRKRMTYTQAEYRAAKRLKLPVFAFVKTTKGNWQNKEHNRVRRVSLKKFHTTVTRDVMPRHFSSAKELREQIAEALRQWDDMGRPGARRVFSTPEQHFRPLSMTLFDFEQKLRGRSAQLLELSNFLQTTEQVVALVL
jgi:hypothetical protein